MTPVRNTPIGSKLLLLITLVTAALTAFIPIAIFYKLYR
jgi:hypothetical protein